MRVINHKQFSRKETVKIRKRSYVKIGSLIMSVVIIITFGIYFWSSKKTSVTSLANNDKSVNNQVAESDSIVEDKSSKPFKHFTGEEFKNLYYGVAYPNTQQITTPISITGNDEADSRIREFAEERGYKQTSIPQSAIVKIDEPRLDGDDLLQPLAALGWKSLKEAAEKDNVDLAITSAYRSPQWQRELFNSRLLINGITPSQVGAGIQDKAVVSTLEQAAVPGYSRHHTGYTVDLWCDDGSGIFVNSSCFAWLKADNYLKAKESGWIPSYPEGADLQGPEPEPWEYVWVGVDNLK
ncbi:MAG: D-alanyl-D-alanine carboxypeptidase family protein [Candidatus Saccharimonadales bacterium]